MTADLFMELLYDFVHGVAPAHAIGDNHTTLRDRPHWQHRFCIVVSDGDRYGLPPAIGVQLMSGMFTVHYTLETTAPLVAV